MTSLQNKAPRSGDHRRNLWVLIALALTAAIASSGTADTRASTKPAAASQQERDDYRTAAAATSGAALDKSAHEFSAKYPQSALRVYLFEKALRQYQIENDSVGVQDAAKAVLTISPDDPLALVLTATTLADELSALEADRDKKVSEIRRSADLAIHNLDRGVLPAAAAPQQAPLYRTTLQAMAYSALGIMKLKTGDDSGAEKDLKTAVELAKARPDPSIWYHLALAQEHRKKYSAAINSVEQAMQLASGNPQLQHLAEMEHDRLWRLAGRNKDSSDSSNNPSPK